jgi:hypothetical protein
MKSFKYFILTSLSTSCIVGQDYPHNDQPQPNTSTALRSMSSQLAQTKSFHDVFQVVQPTEDGTYPINRNPSKIIVSITYKNQIAYVAVDKKLILKYSTLIRNIYDTSFIDQGSETLLEESIPLDNGFSLKDFQDLFHLVYEYDQNPVAYQDEKRFEIDSTIVYRVLRLANFLFAEDTSEKTSADKLEKKDLGFFDTLLKSTANHMFNSDVLIKDPQENVYSLSLPIDIYDRALPFIQSNQDPSKFSEIDVYVFVHTLQSLDENNQLIGDALRLVDKLKDYFTPSKRYHVWTILKTSRMDDVENKTQVDAIDRLEREFSDYSKRYLVWKELRNLQTPNESEKRYLTELNKEFLFFSDYEKGFLSLYQETFSRIAHTQRRGISYNEFPQYYEEYLNNTTITQRYIMKDTRSPFPGADGNLEKLSKIYKHLMSKDKSFNKPLIIDCEVESEIRLYGMPAEIKEIVIIGEKLQHITVQFSPNTVYSLKTLTLPPSVQSIKELMPFLIQVKVPQLIISAGQEGLFRDEINALKQDNPNFEVIIQPNS